MDNIAVSDPKLEAERDEVLALIQCHPNFVIDIQSCSNTHTVHCAYCHLVVLKRRYRAFLWRRFPDLRVGGKWNNPHDASRI